MAALQLLIHAPTADALTRARNNAQNLLATAPDTAVEIVINGPAVAAALDAPHDTDVLLRVCSNTLARLERPLPATLCSVPAAVLHIAQRQRDGWSYMRA